MPGIEESLGRVPMFSQLPKRELKKLASTMKQVTFKPGDVIAAEGEQGLSFFVVAAGTATVAASGDRRSTLKAGDFFGEIALIDGGSRSAQVTAESELTCYGLSAWMFRPFVEDHPNVAWALLTTLAARVRAAEAKLQSS